MTNNPGSWIPTCWNHTINRIAVEVIIVQEMAKRVAAEKKSHDANERIKHADHKTWQEKRNLQLWLQHVGYKSYWTQIKLQLQGPLLPPYLVISMISSFIGIMSLVFRSHHFRHFLYKNFLNSNPLESMIATGQEFRNLGCCLLMMLWLHNNVITIIITAY